MQLLSGRKHSILQSSSHQPEENGRDKYTVNLKHGNGNSIIGKRATNLSSQACRICVKDRCPILILGLWIVTRNSCLSQNQKFPSPFTITLLIIKNKLQQLYKSHIRQRFNLSTSGFPGEHHIKG